MARKLAHEGIAELAAVSWEKLDLAHILPR
jgi:hypothetical protein